MEERGQDKRIDVLIVGQEALVTVDAHAALMIQYVAGQESVSVRQAADVLLAWALQRWLAKELPSRAFRTARSVNKKGAIDA